MNDTNVYQPSDLHTGGRRISDSYLRAYWSCPFEWYLAYLAPHPDTPTARGLAPRYTNENLLIGSGVHDTMYHYRRSAWRDGEDTLEPNLDEAIEIGLVAIEQRRSEWLDDAAYHEFRDLLPRMLRGYHEEGDWRCLRVLGDADGTPYLEREFILPMVRPGDPEGHEPWCFTVKPDMIGVTTEHDPGGPGLIQPQEYKTARSAYFANRYNIPGAEKSSQCRGELATLYSHFQGARMGPLRYVFMFKKKATSDPWAMAWPVDLSASQLEAWQAGALATVEEIDFKVRQWEHLTAQGADPWHTAHALFPMAGRGNGLCQRFGRDCVYLPYCDNLDMGLRTVAGYRGRRAVEAAVDVEWV